jgi:Bacterial SH3 domain
MREDRNFGRKLVMLMGFTRRFLTVDRERGDCRRGEFLMPFHFKALSAALSIIAAAAMAGPVRAQQSPPPAGQESAPGVSPQDGSATRAPITQGPARVARARSASVAATVNLRSGPGTDSEIITTIPAGSTVRVTGCSGEWCEVTWNDHSGFAIARNLNIGAPRQAGAYGPQPRYAGGYGPQPGYPDGYGPEPGVVYGAPGYYGPPAVVYGPTYYGPGVYYGPGWGWRRRWGW